VLLCLLAAQAHVWLDAAPGHASPVRHACPVCASGHWAIVMHAPALTMALLARRVAAEAVPSHSTVQARVAGAPRAPPAA
jgi:hypothetical protein